MSANTVLHNVVITAQFFKRHGRGGITRELQLPEKITTLPREYREEKLVTFLGACNDDERKTLALPRNGQFPHRPFTRT